VCGCGTELQGLSSAALLGIARKMKVELAEWDKFRFLLRRRYAGTGKASPADPLDSFIEDGGSRYRTAVAGLHGDVSAQVAAQDIGPAWFKQSRKGRKEWGRRYPGLIQTGRKVKPTAEDERRTDPGQPNRSYTGNEERL
jgi:hypothetical protein